MMQPVHSTRIAAMEHNPEGNVLRVRFHSGGTYSYTNVPPEVHRQVLSAPSIGKAFDRLVKGRYPHKKL